MKKRLVSAVLALGLLLGSVSVPAFAEETAGSIEMPPTMEEPETVNTPEPTATPATTETPTPTAAPGTGPRRAARNAPALKVTALPTAAGITYNQTLEEAALTGGSVVTEDGTPVKGTFAWKTPQEKPDAGTHQYDVIFTPEEGQIPPIDAGKVQVTVAQAEVIMAWHYDVESMNYTGQPFQVTSPRVITPDGGTHSGTITYEYRAEGESAYQPGMPQDVGTYYARAAIAAQGNYLGAKTEKELKLLIQKRPAALQVEDYLHPYDGNPVTLEEIPKEAKGYQGETLKGTWSFKGTAPEMRELGTYQVTLVFTPEDANYASNEKTIQVTVQPIDLSNAQVTVAGSYPYCGQAYTPSGSDVTVTLNGQTISASDYELSWENNLNAGQAAVIVKGRNNYGGTVRGEFTIDPIPLNITGIKVKSRKYDGTTRVPVESLILEGVLEADKDKVWADPDSLTATVAGTSAGTYDTVTLGPSMELAGSAKGNYTLPGIELTFTGAQVNGGEGVIIEPAPAPAPAPTPDDSVYYTCRACGYHNWTATEAGYRCDTCGYLESVKQLSGYCNVKGVYTPQTNTTAAAASRAGSTESLPQTGDEGNFLLWGCLLVLSSSALAAMEIRRKRN